MGTRAPNKDWAEHGETESHQSWVSVKCNNNNCIHTIMHTHRTMETAEAMLVFNKYDEMVELIQR